MRRSEDCNDHVFIENVGVEYRLLGFTTIILDLVKVCQRNSTEKLFGCWKAPLCVVGWHHAHLDIRLYQIREIDLTGFEMLSSDALL